MAGWPRDLSFAPGVGPRRPAVGVVAGAPVRRRIGPVVPLNCGGRAGQPVGHVIGRVTHDRPPSGVWTPRPGDSQLLGTWQAAGPGPGGLAAAKSRGGPGATTRAAPVPPDRAPQPRHPPQAAGPR